MASADESFEVGGPPSPSPDPRAGLAFKPPTRPGASLRGRKSTAALAELNTNRPPTSMSIASSDPTDTTGSTAKPNSAIDSRPHSPASSYESPTPYEAAPSSNEAQALAATQAARQRLHQLYEENESQTTAAGLLGQGLLDQRRKLEELREQLHEELAGLERDTAPDAADAAGAATGERVDAARYQRVRALAEKIDAETEEMALERKALLVKAMGAGSDNLLVDSASLPSGLGSPSKSPLSTYAFLSSDPAARVTPTKGRNADPSSGGGSGGGPTPRQSDRRARNAAAPSSIGDQNLVNQLQDGLVNEIRRLHSLLLQREQQIKLAEEARKKSEEETATWKSKTLTLIEQEDAFKQENWDLQIARQQLEEQLDEERVANKKLESERNRVTKELAKIRETADERKVQIDGQAAELDRVRTLRETEIALARREKASLQREYSDLQSEAQKYKAEIQKLERANLSRSVSNSMLSFNGPGAADESDDGMVLTEAARRKLAEASAPGSPGGYSEDLSSAQSPLGTRLVRDREISDLRGKLAMAQKKTGKDSAEKRRLRDQNQELRRLLAKAGLDAPISSDVESSDAEDDAESWVDEAGSVGGRGKSGRSRLPKSSTRPNIASRLGLGPSVGSQGASDQDDDVEDSFEDASQSAPDDDSASERPSLEGMDPAFADIGRPEFIKKGSRRSTIKPNHQKRISTSSPLTRQVILPDERGDTTTEELHDDDSGLGEAARMPSNRRGGQRFRPASDVVPAAALGNELAGLDQSQSDINLSVVKEPEATSGGDSSVVIHDNRELEERAIQTQAMPDLVAPALAAQQARHEQAIEELQASHQSRHESAIAELQSRHNAHVDSITRGHDEAVALLRDQHKARLDELAQAHNAALQTRDAKSAEALSEAEKSHESALSAKEAAAAAALAAALATQSKTHDAAMTEARSRHTQALANQVAAHTEALSAAEGKHRAALADRERLHKAELEKREHRHQQALEQKDRDHQAMVEDIQTTNDTFLSQRDAAYSSALKDRDEQVVKTRAEVQRLRAEIEDLSAQLKEAKEQLSRALAEKEERAQELDAARAAHAAALAAATAEVAEARKEQEETQEVLNQQQRAAEAEAEAAANAEPESPAPAQPEPDVPDSARQSADINDVFQDAVDSQDEEPAAPAVPTVPVEEPGIRRVVLADLKDSGIQTDDEVWARIRQEQLSLRPTSVALARPGETAVGPGGLTVLGGYPARPRDSVGTFGGLRDASAGYDRPESPAPTNYSVSALGTSRRPSIDSMISSRRQHDMPPPAIPDKTKPPVMAVPPPPSMPPPSHIPRRSGASVSTEDGVAPPRPTSPPPSKFLARASQRNGSTLQVPGSKDGSELPPRSVSRASSHYQGAAPPTSYVPPGSAPNRQRMPRRSSNVSRADQESIASTSMASRVSGGRLTPNHLRHASGTSVASDVTSELSRRHSVSSSQASDAYNEHPGDKTVTIADSRGLSRRGTRTSPAGMIEATDPAIIQAITKTMIGEYLYKYTRRTMRSGHSDKRHQRYFWVHPYTKMLYWTITDPGGARVAEGTSKSACIEDVRIVDDPSSNPPGLFHLSIVIKTTARELKVTAATKESHETWLNALGYLVNRGNSVTAAADTTIVANATATPASGTLRSRNSTASRAARMLSPARSLASVGRRKSSDSAAAWNDATPRARNASHSGASILDGSSTYRSKRRDTAAREFLQQTALRRTGTSEYGSGAGDHSVHEEMTRSTVDPRLQTAEEMLEENEREGFEGLDNVRACCGGAHDVGALAHKQYLQKQRRGSAVGAGSSRQSTGGRPSSRLSNASSTRPRGASNASGSTDSHHQRTTSSGAGSPAAPPQLGPLNLNAPRGYHSGGNAQGGGGGQAPKGESFASMFDLPPPPPAATSSSRPKSPYGPTSIGSAAPSLSGLQTPTTSASSHGRYPRGSVKMADQFGTTSSSYARSHQR